MKVLHTAALSRPGLGIVNQMLCEYSAAKNLGLSWEVILFCYPTNSTLGNIGRLSSKPKPAHRINIFLRLYNWIRFNQEFFSSLKKNEVNYDILLLRHAIANPFQAYFLKNCQKPVYLVHHTMEEHELKTSSNLILRLLAPFEMLLGRFSIRAASGIIGVTREIARYEIHRANREKKEYFVYPNGVSIRNIKYTDEREDIPEIIFVASHFYSWHGLDLLLNNAKKSDAKFILHLVGNLSKDDYIQASLDPRVRLHGTQTTEYIERLSRRCWLGLSSFALHRKMMSEACTLKVREYLLCGLPVYANYAESFPEEFPFFRRGEANFHEILAYAHNMRTVSRNEVSRMSAQYINKDILLNSLYLYLQSRSQGALAGGANKR